MARTARATHRGRQLRRHLHHLRASPGPCHPPRLRPAALRALAGTAPQPCSARSAKSTAPTACSAAKAPSTQRRSHGCEWPPQRPQRRAQASPSAAATHTTEGAAPRRHGHPGLAAACWRPRCPLPQPLPRHQLLPAAARRGPVWRRRRRRRAGSARWQRVPRRLSPRRPRAASRHAAVRTLRGGSSLAARPHRRTSRQRGRGPAAPLAASSKRSRAAHATSRTARRCRGASQLPH
mmetsp:Transcript_43335/g.140523  ORF Transcript_43335/g.140523 Transcript_43335/m.140523 type:complete len:236 (+) Transcript_43335:995-1702(+)